MAEVLGELAVDVGVDDRAGRTGLEDERGPRGGGRRRGGLRAQRNGGSEKTGQQPGGEVWSFHGEKGKG